MPIPFLGIFVRQGCTFSHKAAFSYSDSKLHVLLFLVLLWASIALIAFPLMARYKINGDPDFGGFGTGGLAR